MSKFPSTSKSCDSLESGLLGHDPMPSLPFLPDGWVSMEQGSVSSLGWWPASGQSPLLRSEVSPPWRWSGDGDFHLGISSARHVVGSPK